MAELERLNDRAYRSTMAVILAECLYEQGRFEETREVCEMARELSPDDDVTNFITLGFLDGALLARNGDLVAAERTGREAVALADTTDHFNSRAHARLHRATLARAGRDEDAAGREGRLAIIEAGSATVSSARSPPNQRRC